MSEWGFVAVCYGLTWTVLGGYALYVRSRSRRAAEALRAAVAEVRA